MLTQHRAGPTPAALVRHLTKLQELSLYGFRRHNLAAMRRQVNMIRILVRPKLAARQQPRRAQAAVGKLAALARAAWLQNPVVAAGEVIGRGANFLLPALSGRPDGDSSNSDSDSSEASGDSFSSATSDIVGDADSLSGGQQPAAVEARAEGAGQGSSAAAVDLGGATATEALPVDTKDGTDDDAHSSSSSSGGGGGGDEFFDAGHGHGHSHHGGGVVLEDDRHT